MLHETEQNVVDGVYEVMAVILKIFQDLDIDYRIIGGTLLGAIRHGGLIPWDDDADFVIQDDDANKLEQALSSSAWRYPGVQATFEWGTYMFGCINGKKLDAWENVFYPYCDVLPMICKGDKLVYRYSEIRKTFPKDFLYVHEWYDVEEYDFGPFRLKGPRMDHAHRYLADAYGPDWSKEVFLTFDKINCQPMKKIRYPLPHNRPAWPSTTISQSKD